MTKNLLILVLVLLLLAGCQVTRHTGRIDNFDSKGNSTGFSEVTLDRQMMMEVTDANGVVVKADSRDVGEGILEGIIKIITLGLIVD